MMAVHRLQMILAASNAVPAQRRAVALPPPVIPVSPAPKQRDPAQSAVARALGMLSGNAALAATQ